MTTSLTALGGCWQLQDERVGEDKDRFTKTLGSMAGRRLTYDELTGKIAPE